MHPRTKTSPFRPVQSSIKDRPECLKPNSKVQKASSGGTRKCFGLQRKRKTQPLLKPQLKPLQNLPRGFPLLVLAFDFGIMDEGVDNERQEYTLVVRKSYFGLPTACPSCLPVYIYLKFAQLPFRLDFNSTYPDSGKILFPLLSFFVPVNWKLNDRFCLSIG